MSSNQCRRQGGWGGGGGQAAAAVKQRRAVGPVTAAAVLTGSVLICYTCGTHHAVLLLPREPVGECNRTDAWALLGEIGKFV